MFDFQRISRKSLFRRVCLLLTLCAGGFSASICTASPSCVLVDTNGVGHGPYAMTTGTSVLNDRYTLDVRGQSTTLLSVSSPDERLGPFFMTNHATIAVAEGCYGVIITTVDFEQAYEIGRQTHLIDESIRTALSDEDARDGLAHLQAAIATNQLCRNVQAVSNAVKRLVVQIGEDDLQRAAGKVKFEGRWLPAAEAKQLQQARVETEMRAKGFQQVDGEWFSIDEARDRRLEKAKAAAQALAAEQREYERNKCRRCNGTGSIYFEIRPSVAAASTRSGSSKPPDMRIERPGLPPAKSAHKIERDACPDCEGTGRRK